MAEPMCPACGAHVAVSLSCPRCGAMFAPAGGAVALAEPLVGPELVSALAAQVLREGLAQRVSKVVA